MLSAAARRGLRAPRGLAPVLIAPGLRAPVLAISTVAADATAANPITTVAGDAPTANVIWMQRELSKIASLHAAKFADLHRETLTMATELKKVEADHANAVSDSKRAVGTSAWRIVIVGGSFLLTVFTLFRDE